MILRVDSSSPVPPYEQIRGAGPGHGRRRRPHARHPPAVDPAAGRRLGLAGGTVARAYRELEQEGVVTTRGRHGTVVAEPSARRPADVAGRDERLVRAASELATAAHQSGTDLDAALAAVRAAFARLGASPAGEADDRPRRGPDPREATFAARGHPVRWAWVGLLAVAGAARASRSGPAGSVPAVDLRRDTIAAVEDRGSAGRTSSPSCSATPAGCPIEVTAVHAEAPGLEVIVGRRRSRASGPSHRSELAHDEERYVVFTVRVVDCAAITTAHAATLGAHRSPLGVERTEHLDGDQRRPEQHEGPYDFMDGTGHGWAWEISRAICTLTRRLGQVDDVLAQGVHHGLDPGVEVELLEDVAHVVLDGVLGDRQLAGDLPVAHARSR